jgi:hypothetical protein
MSEGASAHPAPPHAGPPADAPPAGETSERIFRRRLLKAITSFNIKDMRAMWREELFEPHMHLFVMLVMAFTIGIIIFVGEPALR